MNKLLKSLILEMPFKAPHTKPDFERDQNLRACILAILDLGLYDPERSLDELDYTDLRNLIGKASTVWIIYDKSNANENEGVIRKLFGDITYESVKDGDYVIIRRVVTIDDSCHDVGLVLKRSKLLEKLK